MKTTIKPLRAGTQTGSLINHIISGCGNATPEIGMGVTILGWTDRHAGTILEVSKDGKSITIARDEAKPLHKGMTDCQDYEYKHGTKPYATYTLRRNGRWVAKGQTMNGGSSLKIGERDEYYDFSF